MHSAESGDSDDIAAGQAAAPGPVAPTETFHFSSRDGTDLYGEYFAARAPGPARASALIIHGYMEHCGRYRELAHVLVGAGVSVLSYDMRGHGRAAGQRGYIREFTDYLDDLDAALGQLEVRADAAAAPLLLIGHSNGGLITCRALAD
ncbi:MAG: alpha/beta fold hydrolase, partial [Myxococcota bacterium]